MPLPKFARMLAFIKWHASRFDNLGEREPLADPVGWKRGQRSKSEWLSCKFTEDPVPPLFYPSLNSFNPCGANKVATRSNFHAAGPLRTTRPQMFAHTSVTWRRGVPRGCPSPLQ